jgi:hypothetical protein
MKKIYLTNTGKSIFYFSAYGAPPTFDWLYLRCLVGTVHPTKGSFASLGNTEQEAQAEIVPILTFVKVRN